MTPEELTEPEKVSANQWQRLSPVSIVYFIIKFSITAIKQGFVNAIPALAAFAVFVDNKLFWFTVLIPSMVLAVLVYGVLYYWNFKFQARKGEILINRGVFKKEHLNLKYSRVQNVNISRPFYFAPFKLVNCIIESAGSKTSEVDLPGVSEPFASEMRNEVFAADKKLGAELDDSEENSAVEDGQTAVSESSEPILKLSNWEAAKSGLTSYFALIAIAALGPFFEKFSNIVSDSFFPYLMDIVEPIIGNPIAAGIVIVVASVLAIFILVTSASVIGAFIRYYNFELYNNDDKLVRITGLLERKSTTLTKTKVQSVVIFQNLIARLLNRVNFQYRQIGVNQPNKDDASIQIPMLKPTETNPFASIVFPNCPKPEFSGIHRSYVKRVFFYFCFIPIAAAFSIPSILLSKYFLFAYLILIPIFGLVYLSYRRYGFWFNEEFAAIRSGLFGHRIVIFPLYKVQLTKVTQSHGQRKRNVGSLAVQLGSGIESIPYVPMTTLNKFVNLALYKTESSKKSWM